MMLVVSQLAPVYGSWIKVVLTAFVDWAREQVALFAEMFRRQVYGSDADDKVVKKALAYVHVQSKKVASFIELGFVC